MSDSIKLKDVDVACECFNCGKQFGINLTLEQYVKLPSPTYSDCPYCKTQTMIKDVEGAE